MTNDQKTALVTGASSGIGEEFAIQLAKQGYDLVLVARQEEKLIQLSQQLSEQYAVNCYHLCCDLNDHNASDSIFNYILQQRLQITLLINNAGFGLRESFQSSVKHVALSMIDVNIRALTDLTHRMLAHLSKAPSAQIINIASTAGFMPGPYMAVYYATKAYVISFSLALRKELAASNIFVATVCPGPTKTPFMDKSGLRFENNNAPVVKLLALQTPEYVVKIALKGVKRKKALIVPGVMNKLSVFLQRFTPRWLLLLVVAALQKKQ